MYGTLSHQQNRVQACHVAYVGPFRQLNLFLVGPFDIDGNMISLFVSSGLWW